jgi:ribonuclease J
MCTGSQGEPSSILGRLSIGAYRGFDIKNGDTVILSSHPIPGNEENVYRTINRLFERGANVLYEAIAQVHVSGHASQEEMKMLINLVRPKYFIPVHGELRQLKRHAYIAELMGIPTENIAVVTNGQTIEFCDGQMSLGEKVATSVVFVDGSGVGDVGPHVMREREELSHDGVVMVSLALEGTTNNLCGIPEVVTRGFVDSLSNSELLTGLRRRIHESVAQANGNLQSDVEKSIRAYLYSETHRSPAVFVAINRI